LRETQTEAGRPPWAPRRSRSRPPVPCDWSRRFAKSGKVVSRGAEYIGSRSIVPPRSLTCTARHEFVVLPITSSPDPSPESNCEFLPAGSVFPDAPVIFASSTRAESRLCQAASVSGRRMCKIRRQPGHPSRNKTHKNRSERWRSKRVLLKNRELVTKCEDLRLLSGTGSKTGADQSEKGNENRAHWGSKRISGMLGTSTTFSARRSFRQPQAPKVEGQSIRGVIIIIIRMGQKSHAMPLIAAVPLNREQIRPWPDVHAKNRDIIRLAEMSRARLRG
jgi:hypothetical protein